MAPPPQNVPQPQGAETKRVVQQLDLLLLRAAGKSISADIVKNINTIGTSLITKGVLTQKQLSNLEILAKTAAAKLKALDKFSGRELAEALMEDRKTGEIVWSKGLFFMNSTAKAVKSAIEAQQTLSTELGKFNERLALATKTPEDAKLQDQFTELQFQCDRRALEIDSIVFRMYGLTQQDTVKRGLQDRKITALLDATFNELMPREAIMMHGTAEAFELVNKTMGEQLRPLIEKLDAFAADSTQVLSQEEILSLKRDMTTMKNASAMRARETFLQEVKASLYPEDAPGGDKVVQENTSNYPIIHEFKLARNEFIRILHDCASGKLSDEDFYNKLMEMKPGSESRRKFLESIAPRISKEALTATEMRLDEAIKHAEKLFKDGKVYGNEQWRSEDNLSNMKNVAWLVEIKKSDGTTTCLDPNLKCVKDLRTRECPSLYKREKFHETFIEFQTI